jgi:hypothetical protein
MLWRTGICRRPRAHVQRSGPSGAAYAACAPGVRRPWSNPVHGVKIVRVRVRLVFEFAQDGLREMKRKW